MRTFFCILIFCIFSYKSLSQDSAITYFNNSKVILPTKSLPNVKFQDSSFIRTLIVLGDGKFFYIKQRSKDSLNIECGPLTLYKISDESFLLREGIWILENRSEKVLFQNLGKNGILEEFEEELQPAQYEGVNKRKAKKKRLAKRIG